MLAVGRQAAAAAVAAAKAASEAATKAMAEALAQRKAEADRRKQAAEEEAAAVRAAAAAGGSGAGAHDLRDAQAARDVSDAYALLSLTEPTGQDSPPSADDVRNAYDRLLSEIPGDDEGSGSDETGGESDGGESGGGESAAAQRRKLAKALSLLEARLGPWPPRPPSTVGLSYLRIYTPQAAPAPIS